MRACVCVYESVCTSIVCARVCESMCVCVRECVKVSVCVQERVCVRVYTLAHVQERVSASVCVWLGGAGSGEAGGRGVTSPSPLPSPGSVLASSFVLLQFGGFWLLAFPCSFWTQLADLRRSLLRFGWDRPAAGSPGQSRPQQCHLHPRVASLLSSRFFLSDLPPSVPCVCCYCNLLFTLNFVLLLVYTDSSFL